MSRLGVERPVEFEIVRLAGNPHPSEDDRRRLRTLASGSVNWMRVPRIGARHGLLSLVARGLEAYAADLLPDDVRQGLRDGAAWHAMRSLAQVRELLEVLDALEALGIAAVPYKGPTLSVQLYGSPALRESCDIDLLVRPEDVSAARSVLLERGYGEHEAMDGARGTFMLESRYHQRFERDPGTVLELHWGFRNRDVAFPLSLKELQPRLGFVRLGGRSVPVFAWEDLVLILCVHGAKHRWNRLELILGVAEAARQISDRAWPELLARARHLRCRREVLLGLEVARRLAGLALPGSSYAAVAADDQVTRLAGEVEGLLLDEDPVPESQSETLSLEQDLFHFRLREGLRARVRYLMYRFTTPSRPGEWRAVRVAGRAVPLHGVVRPVRTLFRLAPAVRRYLWDRRTNGSRRMATSAWAGTSYEGRS